MIRLAVVRIHRWVGLSIAIFLTLASVTGSILVFDEEIDRFLNRDLFYVPARDAPPLSLDALRSRLQAQYPNAQFNLLPLPSAPDRALVVYPSQRTGAAPLGYDELFIDPYDGSEIGRRTKGACCLAPRAFISWINEFHYNLTLPGRIGTWLLGLVALIWLFDAFAGVYLTFPRGKSFWPKWRKAWQLKWSRLNFDLHRAGGLWLMVVSLVLAFTSVYLNLGRELVIPPLRLIQEPTVTLWDTDRSDATGASERISPLTWADAAGRGEAEARALGWEQALESIQWYPEYRSHGLWWLSFGLPTEGAFRYGYYGLTLDGRSGAVVEVYAPGWGNAADRFLAAQFPLHSGEAFGLPGRIAVFISGLLIPLLIWTGIVIWWRKRRVRTSRSMTRAYR